ncbi:hypothetical protein IMG5_120970 [Ichthyophthirius multifiliis]|uniref:Uncharacterized protein n=1 Tax=Ichthyophthirius multifiliis TaxID=5932 RepID=G0QV25_ICHMU|nr:hypothetical protein IMG5_120970 [Ichthyophthirius multifiliis]EGR30932.1 hypothetical protein IMG5_120970 [Ichthyophthirius multifiliis]|eukprot:XP_004032519.1 hypothetical protein IMG5_120970 [Ichthyophthirius multifiliis]
MKNQIIVNKNKIKKYLQQIVYNLYLKPKNLQFTQIIILISVLQKVFFTFAYKIIQKNLPYLQISVYNVNSHFLRQIKFKLQVIQSWKILLKILKNKDQGYQYSFILKIYMQLFSGITYIAIDTILGILSIFFIVYNVSNILGFIHQYFSGIHIDELEKEVEWLMGDPAGLKTNKSLNKIMGFLISKLFILWNYFTTFGTPFEPYLVTFLSFFGFFGISFVFCIINDLINILTLHIYIIYKLLLIIYKEVMNLIIFFFKVMKGQIKQYNKKEITWDQKVISLIFFFFLVSMFPTISVYYYSYLFIVLFVYMIKVNYIKLLFLFYFIYQSANAQINCLNFKYFPLLYDIIIFYK